MTFQAIVFDLDGTLIDTRDDVTNAVNATLKHAGLPALSCPEVTDKIGQGISILLQRAMPRCSMAEVREYRKYFYDFYREHIADFSRPYAGLRELLRKSTQYKFAILTNKDETLATELLQALQLDQFFQAIYGGGRPFPAKPAPDGLRALLQEMNINPAATLMIGDSPSDIVAGWNAGAVTCGALYGYRPETELRQAKADFYIAEPQELLSLI